MRRLLALAAMVFLALPPQVHAEDGPDLSPLTGMIARQMPLDCTVRWTQGLSVQLRIAADGRLAEAPVWRNPVDDPALRKIADRLIRVIVANQPYDHLSATIYDKPVSIDFDQSRACGQTK